MTYININSDLYFLHNEICLIVLGSVFCKSNVKSQTTWLRITVIDLIRQYLQKIDNNACHLISKMRQTLANLKLLHIHYLQ